jgi:hypothetical protein
VIRDCDLSRCDRLQRVVVRDSVGDRLNVCFDHWREALEISGGLIRGVALLDAPPCARAGCHHDAQWSVPDFAGGRTAVCQEHHDDLGWTATRQPLVDGHLGASHG